MENQWAEWIVFLVMIAIVIALGSGLYFILFQKEKSDKAVKALTFRIGLSILLFAGLFVAFAAGWIKPHGLTISNIQKRIKTTTPHPQNANTTIPPQTQNGGSD